MKTLYLDCFSGISGDMFAAAMLGLGVDGALLSALPGLLGLDGVQIAVTKKTKGGIAAVDFNVILPEEHDGTEHDHHAGHRRFADIAALIEKSSLSADVKALALRIFTRIAGAEGKIHGLPAADVQFHEVGAVDSIIDIVAAAVCVEALKPDRVVCSPLTEGSGTVACAHGILPVPAPATAEILRAGAVPFRCTDAGTELVTPTGAAITAELAQQFGPMPPMTALGIGYGCGKKELAHPNLLRAVLGESVQGCACADRAAVLETTIDDSTGEALGFCVERLFSAGAKDAFFTPVFMKKGRPAYELTVLCAEEQAGRFARLVFEHTGSIGLRLRVSDRIVMQRRNVKVATKYGEIDCKLCEYDGIEKLKPEYESLKSAAAAHGVALDAVSRAVLHNIE